VSSTRVDAPRVDSPAAPVGGASESARHNAQAKSESTVNVSLVSDVAPRFAALHNLGESLKLTQLAETALDNVATHLGALTGGGADTPQALADTYQALDQTLSALPAAARPMIPATAGSDVFSVPMSPDTLIPGWAEGTTRVDAGDLSRARGAVDDVRVNLAGYREELLSAAGALGLISDSGRTAVRPGASDLGAAAGQVAAVGDLSGVHGHLTSSGVLKSLTS
jgi:hypothetical protein